MPLPKCIKVRGGRSLRDVDLELGPVTVLIGAAGATKSNLLDSRRMVTEAHSGSREQLTEMIERPHQRRPEIDERQRELQHTKRESTSDGPDTAPSKRLERCFENYQKLTDGLLAMDAEVLPDLRDACPRFSRWLARLETLGRT